MTCLCPGLKLSGFCFCVVLLCSMLLNVHFLLRELHKARHPDVGVTRLRLDDTLKVALVLVSGCFPAALRRRYLLYLLTAN